MYPTLLRAISIVQDVARLSLKRISISEKVLGGMQLLARNARVIDIRLGN
jgi:hypothetical protein